jgi:hypothetical protein
MGGGANAHALNRSLRRKAQALDFLGGANHSMHLLFIDEFGHENTKARGQSPVFGYGGFIIPADRFSEFASEFFDIKVAAFRPLYRMKLGSSPTTGERDLRARDQIRAAMERLSSQDISEYFQDPGIRQIVARYEIKGSDLFSSSYISKMARRAAERGSPPGTLGRIRGRVRFAKWLLRSLQYYDAEIFYTGFHRSQVPLLKNNEKIHVALVKNVIDHAYEYALSKNSTVQIIFDHHYTDVGHSIGPMGSLPGMVKTSRAERAREIVMSKAYYHNLTEPIFNAKSHLSQGVQAADWVCAILKILLVHRAEGNGDFTAFASHVEQALFSNATEQSEFRMIPTPLRGRLFGKQEQLSLKGGSGTSSNPSRPYRG